MLREHEVETGRKAGNPPQTDISLWKCTWSCAMLVQNVHLKRSLVKQSLGEVKGVSRGYRPLQFEQNYC